jgi:phosphoribosyl-AMP cyclohydrolase
MQWLYLIEAERIIMHKEDNEQKRAPLKIETLKYDQNNLIPAVIQDDQTDAVLMVGYMNKEALRRTLQGGRVCFWSRSRQEYWVKGETSGNLFSLKSIKADCDADALLVRVDPQGDGVACHTGSYSCFFQDLAEVNVMNDD